MKTTKVHILFYTRKDEPTYELIKVYGNEIDALIELDRMRDNEKDFHYGYVISEILR